MRSDFEKEKEKPSLAMMLVIDKSGSMGGEKIEMAKEAAKSAVELLGPRQDRRHRLRRRDLLGQRDPVGCRQVSGARPDQQHRGRWGNRHGAGHGGSVRDAAEHRREAQARDHPDRRHLGARRLRGDRGQTWPAAASPCSTVAVGDDADQKLLEEIARIGNGRFYFTDDPGNVPQIFAKETVTASKSAINEQPFVPQVVRPTQVLADIDFETAPFLLGYVTTRAKPTSEVILATESRRPAAGLVALRAGHDAWRSPPTPRAAGRPNG